MNLTNDSGQFDDAISNPSMRRELVEPVAKTCISHQPESGVSDGAKHTVGKKERYWSTKARMCVTATQYIHEY